LAQRFTARRRYDGAGFRVWCHELSYRSRRSLRSGDRDPRRCTANILPLADGRGLLGRVSLSGSCPPPSGSAGLLEGGRERPPEVDRRAGEERRSAPRPAEPAALQGDLQRADLVLGMERAHVRHAVLLEPEAWPRTFTLKELVRRGAELGSRPPGESPARGLARAHEGRDRPDMLGTPCSMMSPNPYGGPSSAYEAAVIEIEDLVDRLVSLLWP